MPGSRRWGFHAETRASVRRHAARDCGVRGLPRLEARSARARPRPGRRADRLLRRRARAAVRDDLAARMALAPTLAGPWDRRQPRLALARLPRLVRRRPGA